MPKKSEFQMSSKLIKPNTHINGVENHKMIPIRGDWEIQCIHAFFLLKGGWGWERWYPQRPGAKSEKKTHEDTLYSIALQLKTKVIFMASVHDGSKKLSKESSFLVPF